MDFVESWLTQYWIWFLVKRTVFSESCFWEKIVWVSLPLSDLYLLSKSFYFGLVNKYHFADSKIDLCLTEMLQPGFSVHGDSPGKNTGVGCHALHQGIFPTQGSNSGLLQYKWILYHRSHQGSPRILECVACPFSKGSSQPRSQTGVSCITGGFFTIWAIRVAR